MLMKSNAAEEEEEEEEGKEEEGRGVKPQQLTSNSTAERQNCLNAASLVRRPTY